jgi:hypothetical protein
MIVLPTLEEFPYFNTMERGAPNKEAVVVKAGADLNLGSYILITGYRQQDGTILPYFTNVFRFGPAVVKANDWLFIYTGSGTNSKRRSTDDRYDIYVAHWGQPYTLFANESIVPVLLRTNGVLFPDPPQNLPQSPLALTQTLE